MLTRIVFLALIAIQVTYSQRSQYQTMIGCENSTLSLICPIGSYVSIIRANYGRFSISVCNHQARQDIDTDCTSQENSTALLRKMCNKLSFCHVLISTNILPSICPGTPKYLEAQYQCVSHDELAEKVRQTKLPHLGRNMSDVWSDRDILLDIDDVEDAIKTVIRHQHIPITEEPNAISVISTPSDIFKRWADPTKVVTSVNSLRPKLKVSEHILLKTSITEKNVLFSQLQTKPVRDNDLLNDKSWQLTFKEVLIIILSSSICVIFVIIAVAIFLSLG